MRTISDVMNMSINQMEFSVRSSNCMNHAGIKTLAQLTAMSQEQLSKMRNCGKKSLDEITEKLISMELCFEMNDRLWLAWGLHHIDLIKSL